MAECIAAEHSTTKALLVLHVASIFLLHGQPRAMERGTGSIVHPAVRCSHMHSMWTRPCAW